MMYARRSKPLTACVLILMLAVGFCPAVSVFAASTIIPYSTSVGDKIGYPWQLENSMLESGLYQDGSKREFASGILEVSQIIEFRIVTSTTATAPTYPYQLMVTSGGKITWNNPLRAQYPNVTLQSVRAEAVYDEYDMLQQDVNLVLYNVTRDGSVQPNSNTCSCNYAFRVSGDNTNLSQEYLLKVKVTNTYWVGYDNSPQLISLNLSQLWINNANSVTVTNTWRQGVITPLADYDPNSANVQSINNAIVNESVAANSLDQVNTDFTNHAAGMESQQAVLEQNADTDIDAVDVNTHLNIANTYRQSLNFWMRCVNYLPTAAGSIWEVFVFGVFLAFILFILRLNR